VAQRGCARLARQKADQELAARIRVIHADHEGTYGSPRITAELRGQGSRGNHKRVEREMRTFGIAGLRLRPKVGTTVPEPDATPVPDLLRRTFTAPAPIPLPGHGPGPGITSFGGLVDRRSHAHRPG
jgi:transposase InsO family protein